MLWQNSLLCCCTSLADDDSADSALDDDDFDDCPEDIASFDQRSISSGNIDYGQMYLYLCIL